MHQTIYKCTISSRIELFRHILEPHHIRFLMIRLIWIVRVILGHFILLLHKLVQQTTLCLITNHVLYRLQTALIRHGVTIFGLARFGANPVAVVETKEAIDDRLETLGVSRFAREVYFRKAREFDAHVAVLLVLMRGR